MIKFLIINDDYSSSHYECTQCFAMEVARSIGQDKGTSSSSNLYVSLSPGPNLSPSDRDSKDKEEESGLVLDVALTLCSIAAKQVIYVYGVEDV